MKKYWFITLLMVFALFAVNSPASAASMNVINKSGTNHSEDSAQLIVGNTEVTGTYNLEDGDHYYRLELSKGSKVTFTFSNKEKVNGFKWYIYSENDDYYYNALNKTSINVSSPTSTTLTLKPGSYYIKVTNSQTKGDYSLKTAVTEYSLTDTHQNSSENHAFLVGNNTTVHEMISDYKDNTDYYQIELSKTSKVTFTFKNVDKVNGFNWFIYPGERYYYNNLNPTAIKVKSDTVQTLTLEPGTYFIRITNDSYTGRYTLNTKVQQYKLTNTGGANSEDTAYVLANNKPVYEISSNYNDDVDYYQLELRKKSHVTLNFINTDKANGFNWYIYPKGNYYYNHLNKKVNLAVKSPSKFHNVLNAGTYYIKVENDKSVGRYTIKANINTDITKPVFKGISNKTIKIKQSFNPRAGVTAKDNVDGNITKKIKISGSVNTKKKGKYTLTYTVLDKAGNKATAKRIITVK